jgi:pyruvate dehydrogenase E2 component (dihydrolipoamide acetyltransferase)
MTIEFTLPDLGENIEEADVLRVLVSEGETVELDQAVIEIETEKATLEVPSPAAGTIGKIHVKEGETIKPGQVILVIEEAEGGKVEKPSPTVTSAEPPSAGEMSPEQVQQAPSEARDEPPPEPERAPREEPPPKPPVERPAATAERERPAATAERDRPAADEERERPGETGDGTEERMPVAAAPSVRRFAREVGVDLTAVEGSGSGGRVLLDDVKRASRDRSNGAGGGLRLTVTPLPDFSPYGEVDREPMSRVRRSTAENLAQSWATIPHVTIFEKVDVTQLEAFRQRYRKRVEAAGGKLTLMAILLKIVAAGLREHPKLNASIDLARREVVFKRYYHLGVATDTDRGLLVPVVRDVDTKSITAIAVELGQLAEKARAAKLTPQEMQGASFTISNLGGMGTGLFTPIINPPEVAILGVGKAVSEPMVVDGAVVPRLQLPLSLSFDHRLVDGADGAEFVAWLVTAIHEPLLIALE